MGNWMPWFEADRFAEDVAFAGILGGALDEPAAVADGLGGNQDALGVPTVDDIAKSQALFADQILHRHFDIIEEDALVW
jgi:hypothetical protein